MMLSNIRMNLNKIFKTPHAQKMYQLESLELDEVQRELLRDLQTKGIAITHFDNLIGDYSLWKRISADSNNLISRAKEMPDEKLSAKQDDYKDHIKKLLKFNEPVSLDNIWLTLAVQKKILTLVNAYLAQWCKLVYFDVWYTKPMNPQESRIYSQNWHRDPDDQQMVKVFLYLSDVGQDDGALEYVIGSSLKIAPHYKTQFSHYPEGDKFNAFLKQQNCVKALGKRGTIVLCDTTGFHRGGYSTKNPRVLSAMVYVTAASIMKGRFKIKKDESFSKCEPSVRFTLENS